MSNWLLVVGCWMLDVGCWMLDVGLSREKIKKQEKPDALTE